MVKASSFEVVWDRKALDNLQHILDYLSKQSDQAPKTVKKGILSKIEIIRTSPLICEPDKLKDPKSKDFRAFAIFNYRVTYQIKSSEKEIRIVRVRHTSREPLGY